ncbi:MAG: HipA domain-containing protein [Bacteroidetes bacterium]|nr:HipA domain-containing protein [Bacteroidota bacterium]
MENKCLYCYEPLESGRDFHEKCSKKFFGTFPPPEFPYSIEQMSQLAKNVVERRVTVPGVQPKLSLSLIKKTQENARLTVVGALGGNYIFKPPSLHYPQMPENEHATMRVAEAFGIKVVPSSLIRLASGELAYITKRIDRAGKGQKIHMLDMFQITEAFDKYRSSMERIGKAINQYSSNPLLDNIFYFELTLFSFLTGNNDMHLKNFSMIKQKSEWVLAPAYDLLNVAIVLPDDSEEMALTIEGKRKKLQKEHFLKLGKGLKLTEKQINRTFKRIVQNKSKAIEWIDRSFLAENMKNAYKEILDSRYGILVE